MSHEHETAKIAHASHVIKQSTNLLPHELDALKKTALLGDHNIDSLFMLLGKVEVLNGKLHRQLVEWHTRFPVKPSLVESDLFWSDLKELRATKEQLQYLLDAITEHEHSINTLKEQLHRTQSSVHEVEQYFDGYLNRVNRS